MSEELDWKQRAESAESLLTQSRTELESVIGELEKNLPAIELVVARAGIEGVTDESIHLSADPSQRAAAQALVDLRALLSRTNNSPSPDPGLHSKGSE